MEIAVRDAKARLSELIAAAQAGERVVITRNGTPAAELVRVQRRGGVDFDRLKAARARLGLKGDGAGWPAAFDESDLSRRVLGLE